MYVCNVCLFCEVPSKKPDGSSQGVSSEYIELNMQIDIFRYRCSNESPSDEGGGGHMLIKHPYVPLVMYVPY